MTRVLVCGSRSVHPDPGEIRSRLLCLDLRENLTVVSGGAKGADRAAERAAEEYGFGLEVHRPDWRSNGVYDPTAGFKRNIAMLESGVDHVLAFWDGQSRGTAQTLTEAKRRGIRCWIVRYG